MDRVHQRHDGLCGEHPPVQIGDDALADLCPLPEYRGDENAGNPREPLQHPLAPEPILLGLQEHVGDLRDHLLALPDDDGIEERRHGQRVENAGPAGNHDGVPLAALTCPKGHAPQLEHGEDIRVGKLVLKGKTDEVEFRKRRTRLEA